MDRQIAVGNLDRIIFGMYGEIGRKVADMMFLIYVRDQIRLNPSLADKIIDKIVIITTPTGMVVSAKTSMNPDGATKEDGR